MFKHPESIFPLDATDYKNNVVVCLELDVVGDCKKKRASNEIVKSFSSLFRLALLLRQRKEQGLGIQQLRAKTSKIKLTLYLYQSLLDSPV